MRKQITIPFLKVDKMVPLVRFSYKGEVYCGIVDTGADVTIFGDAIQNDNPSNGQEINLVAFSGEKTSAAKETTVDLDFFTMRGKTAPIKITGIHSDLSILQNHLQKNGINLSLQLIIGSDMLHKYQADINFEYTKMIVLQ